MDYPAFDEIIPSANFNERGGAPVDLLILHYTGMPDDDAAVRWLADPKSKVSCHYVVHQDGRIVQMVEEEHRAWHAGRAVWKGVDDINARSVGIEICNPGHEHGYVPFPQTQIDAVIELSVAVIGRHEIAAEHVLGHSDVAPSRKQDPGELFPWDELARKGVGYYLEPLPIKDGRFLAPGDSGPPVKSLQEMLALFGYGIELTAQFDEQTETVVRAFQRHFRPMRVDGIADSSTVSTLHRLLSGLIA
ncbi:MAG: N-acetylmuramoyl-L-alanine amidase [Pseudomonadota bacterium]